MATEKEKEKVVDDKFTKNQLLECKELLKYADIINAIFENNKEYSIKEAKKIIKNFMEREVN